MTRARAFLIIIVLFGATTIVAQSYQKEAKKQAKALEKEGWQVLPGSDVNMIEQLAKSLETRSKVGSGLLISEGTARTSVFEAALKGSKLVAQRNLAGLFASSVSSLVQINQGSELESFLSESVVKVSASLRTNTIMTIYRENDGEYEFRTVVTCGLRDFWNMLPQNDKEKLETEFGLSDEVLENTGG